MPYASTDLFVSVRQQNTIANSVLLESDANTNKKKHSSTNHDNDQLGVTE
jgi:hypothetical protein